MPPLYEYQCPECPECHATLERLEPFQSPKPVCIHCANAEMERKVSAGTDWWFKGASHE